MKVMLTDRIYVKGTQSTVSPTNDRAMLRIDIYDSDKDEYMKALNELVKYATDNGWMIVDEKRQYNAIIISVMAPKKLVADWRAQWNEIKKNIA